MADPRTPIEDHPEMDPAEGSREVIDKDLAEQNYKPGGSGQDENAKKQDGAKE